MRYSLAAIQACAEEVERQGDGPMHVSGLINAVDFAFQNSTFNFVQNGSGGRQLFLQQINELVELHDTDGSYRIKPVTFIHGGQAVHYDVINDAMHNLMMAFGDLTAEEWTKELLTIHPWADGNGRVAFVVWNVFFNQANFSDNCITHLSPTPDFFSKFLTLSSG